MPSPCATHAEAGQGHPPLIGAKSLGGVVTTLEDIGLSGGLPAIAEAAKGVNNQRALGPNLIGLARRQATVNKVQIRGGIAAAMQPDHHGWPALGQQTILGHLHPIGLGGAIDARIKAQQFVPRPIHPRRPALLEGGKARSGLVHQGLGLAQGIRGLLVKPLLKIHGVAQGLEQHGHIGRIGLGLQRSQGFLHGLEISLKSLNLRRRWPRGGRRRQAAAKGGCGPWG